MVLPGIQALFGFQLVAVFNSRFDSLDVTEQVVHLVSTCLVAGAVALVMSPAAYHRQAEPYTVSVDVVAISTKLLIVALVLLAFALSLELYVIIEIVLGSTLAIPAAAILLAWTLTLWFGLPRSKLLRRLVVSAVPAGAAEVRRARNAEREKRPRARR